MSSEHLDPVLKKHLARVAAPANLWNRVRTPMDAPVKASPWMAWGTAAAVLAMTASGWVALKRQPVTVEAMALAALDRAPQEFTLQTEDAAAIRKWVRTNSGIDIPLPPKHAKSIRINGARLEQQDKPFAEVSYEVGEFRAALLVSKDPSGAKTYPKHDFRGSDPLEEMRVTSWSMKGQSYTLAWTAPGEFRTACLLCHDQEPPLVAPSATRAPLVN